MSENLELKKFVKKVRENRKYQSIMPELVKRLAKIALEKGLEDKAAVKDVRNKLHQVGNAYFTRRVDYQKTQDEMKKLPQDLQIDRVHQFCLKTMNSHASTAERIPILETFFKTTLQSISPVRSVLDLACGMTPLSIPWIPLDETFSYQACDIYLDMLTFLQTFFNHFQIEGEAFTCDLVGRIPKEKSQVAFILKSIPCLEQVDKEIGLRLLEGVQAEHILVSFPVRSLGGHRKGMPDFYQAHFYEMVSEKHWQITRFEFETELAFLVTK